MKLAELLLEDRNAYIAQQQGDAILQAYKKDRGRKPELDSAEQIVQMISQSGPKNVQWLVNQYINGSYKLEDLPLIKTEIDLFNKVKTRLPVKDLNQYKTLFALRDTLQPYEQQPEPASKREQEQLTKAQASKIYEDDDVLVIVPKTQEASCMYGKGTKWCTAASGGGNAFGFYSELGPLYIVIDKQHKRKFQIHIETASLMDERDKPVKPELFWEMYPAIYQLLIPKIKNSGTPGLLKSEDLLKTYPLTPETIKQFKRKVDSLFDDEQNIEMENLAKGYFSRIRLQPEDVEMLFSIFPDSVFLVPPDVIPVSIIKKVMADRRRPWFADHVIDKAGLVGKDVDEGDMNFWDSISDGVYKNKTFSKDVTDFLRTYVNKRR